MQTSSPFYISRKNSDCPIVDKYELCRDCNLDKLCLLNGLDKHIFNRFEKCFSGKVLLQAGQYLYQRKAPLKDLFWLEKGLLKNSYINCDGEEDIDMFYFSGQLIGLDGIHSGYFPYDCIAGKKSTLYLISYDKFQKLSEEVPHLQNNLMKLLANEIGKRHHFNANLNREPKVRFASFILNICDKKDTNQGIPFIIEHGISNKDLARYLEMDTEVLAQTIYELELKGIVLIKKQSIVILDFKGLFEIIEDSQF